MVALFVNNPAKSKALEIEVIEQTGLEAPELEIADQLQEMFVDELSPESLAFRTDQSRDENVWLENVCKIPAVNQPADWLESMFDSRFPKFVGQ
jgi:hypothetical protein